MSKILLTAVFLSVSVAGCAPAETAALSLDEESALRVLDGSPEGLGMLAFLNHASTTYALLDDTVGLDRRAAESIIAHRNGPDGTLGWLKDDLFDSVEEVDDCYYVGATALGRIETYATENGWVALDDDDDLGTWDGVSFTLGEARSTVELANAAGSTYLDDDLGLDARAVKSIVAARPIANVQALSELYYVGGSALTAIKTAADGVEGCDVEGWDTEYIYDEGDGAWRKTLPAGFVAVVDEVLLDDEWCGEASGDPWFVKATVDRFDCEAKGYTIELGQGMKEYPEISWYIEFEVDADFDYTHSACEV